MRRLCVGGAIGWAAGALLAVACGSAHDAVGGDGARDRDRGSDESTGSANAGNGSAGEAAGSAGAAAEGAPDAATDDESGPTATPEGLIADPQNYVFDQDALRHYEVEVDPAEWAHINETAYLEEYIEARLTIDGETYGPIGLRFKGFRGSLYNCFDFDEQGNLLGRHCNKLSLKLAFDEYDEMGRFHGLKKLNFHAMRNDASMMRERLGYWVFREFGVPAPRAVHATLTVNGEDQGLFALVEEVDGTFARARFPDGGKGNVYKERWPMSSADPEYFRSGLESNRSDPDVDVSPMVRFAEALMAAGDDEVESVLRSYTELDVLMRYLAVDRALGHWDGPTAFRCQPASDVPPLPPEVLAAQTPPLGWETCQNKNFFWYQETDRDHFWMIAWDLDVSLSSFSQFPDWNTEPTSCQIQQQGRPPRCDKLIDWFATVLRPEYERAGQALLDGPFRPEVMVGMVERWYAQIQPIADSGGLTIGLLSLAAAIDQHYADFQQDVQRGATSPHP